MVPSRPSSAPEPPPESPEPLAPDDGVSTTPSTVEWAYHNGTVRWLRWLAYAAGGVLGGVLLAILGMLLGVVAGALIFGSWEVRALAGLFVLVGGPFSLMYLWPLLTDPDQRAGGFAHLFHGDYRVAPPLDRRRLAVAAVLGAVLVVAAAVVAIEAVYALTVAALLVGGFALACSTKGTLDADDRTLSNPVRTRSLDRVTAVRRYDVGPFAVFRLTVARGSGSLRAPRLLHVPRGVGSAAERVLRHAANAEHESSSPDRTVQVAAAALGVVFLATAVGLVLFVPALGLAGAGLFGLFALLLFAVAVVEG